MIFFFFPWLQWGALNFGDSDLPPYRPNTLFENCLDAVWLAAALLLPVLGFFFVKFGIELILITKDRRGLRANSPDTIISK